MAVIAVCNQKGGCGKTTLVFNLAQAFALEGDIVLLVDLDPQGSAVDWRSMSPAAGVGFEVEPMERAALVRNIRNLRREHDFVLIDCPPQYADLSADAIRVSDLVLVPVQPSPLDVWATGPVVDLVLARQEATGGAPRGAYVISRAISNTALQRSLAQALEQQRLPVLSSGTTQRVAYAVSAAAGGTVFDGRPGAARREIEALRDEIKELLKDDQS